MFICLTLIKPGFENIAILKQNDQTRMDSL